MDYEEMFGPDGPLARALPGFATRAEQIAMARLVHRALERGERLIVEAGTGTGKTFAYLAPALNSSKRVIVSTGTRTLQDQLYHRDLPMIAQALGRPVRVALLKGRANYLCLHRLSLAEQQAAARGMRREVAVALPEIREWSRITRTGDIAEVHRLSDEHPVWPWVTSTRENCLGADCEMFERCHVVHARREAQAADVIVVNHHLLLADLVLKEEGFGDLLPGADAVIIDEAHQFPDIASSFLGFAVSSRQIELLARDLEAELLLCHAPIEGCAALAQTLERQLRDLEATLDLKHGRRELAEWPAEVFEAIEQIQASLVELARKLEAAADDSPGLVALRRRSADIAERLHALLDTEAAVQTASVRWAQLSRHGMSLHYVPIDVSDQLGALIDAHASAWIFTSATLAVGDEFSHFERRIGLVGATSARFESPFDYARQTLLYLPRDLDAPSSSRYTEQVIDAALPVLQASGGRAFLLFTSHRALREAADILLRKLGPELPYPVYVQGDGPRDVLLKKFREAGNAVLLGTSTFWEGVDVKGAALTVVVIDKLPFAVPDDPVLKARIDAISRRGGNPFFEEQVPRAVLALKQGVGRLIRDPEDFGVVVLCDPRLRTRGYGRIFLDSLPPMPRASCLDEVVAFLRARLGGKGQALCGRP
ncbi:MAG: ATP-dependent DNA helicase [Gammaproteobacteria bacterium]|nr:helicase [Gammaproteobacteria bacterium]